MAAAADSRAEKQLETMYKCVDTLKDVGFPKFHQQMKLQAFHYGWPDFILDQSVDEPDNITVADKNHKKNAFKVFMNKCNGHQVEYVRRAQLKTW